MSDMPVLKTERLVLRPLLAEDGPTIERLAGDRAIADTTLAIPHPYPPGAAAPWIALHGPAWEKRTALTLAVTRLAPGELIGVTGLMGIDAVHGHAELGYWIAVPHWGRGYATEAANALIVFGFRALQLHRIHARHMVRNPASGRVMEKLGMTREGALRGAICKWGCFEDLAMWSILAPEWRAVNSAHDPS